MLIARCRPHVACHMLHAICCMLHVACCMVLRRTLHAVRRMLAGRRSDSSCASVLVVGFHACAYSQVEELIQQVREEHNLQRATDLNQPLGSATKEQVQSGGPSFLPSARPPVGLPLWHTMPHRTCHPSCAHRCHIYTVTGLAPATSAPGLGISRTMLCCDHSAGALRRPRTTCSAGSTSSRTCE